MRRGKRILSDGMGVSRDGWGFGTRSSKLPSNSESGIRNSVLIVPPSTEKSSGRLLIGIVVRRTQGLNGLNKDQADKYDDPNDPSGQGHVTQDRPPHGIAH